MLPTRNDLTKIVSDAYKYLGIAFPDFCIGVALGVIGNNLKKGTIGHKGAISTISALFDYFVWWEASKISNHKFFEDRLYASPAFGIGLYSGLYIGDYLKGM
ncbi:hypothetical protein J4458_06390 [Candidatus Woesearchaeota archaeon]|nr:hypothetical protein [Candidatus Woesearchaeota archaeon]